jgi:hypothetical protein
MKFKFKLMIIFAAVFFPLKGVAQTVQPAETRNAALRYWLAFSELQDMSTDPGFSDQLNKVLSGSSPWDEAKFGPLLEKNAEALATFRRATKLPDCDWGLEYSLGSRATSVFVNDAERALNRLNTLDGIRQQSKGDVQEAVDDWLAGVQFSQHLAHGQSLLGTLVAASALRPNLENLSRETQNGVLNVRQKSEIDGAIRALPGTGFDWGQAIRYEESSVTIAAQELAKSPNPTQTYQELMGEAAPRNFSTPTARDFDAYHRVMIQVEQAFELSPEHTAVKLESLKASIASLHPFFQRSIPSLRKINDHRAAVQAARNAVLQQLTASR